MPSEAKTPRHRWGSHSRLPFSMECELCGLGRSRDSFRMLGSFYLLAGRLGLAAYDLLRVKERRPLRLELRQYGREWLLFVSWLHDSSRIECLLAQDPPARHRGAGYTETQIMLPCPGSRPDDWRAPWLAHLEWLLEVATNQGCSRCRARAGEWCKTSSYHGVPGLHHERTAVNLRPATPAPEGRYVD